MKRIGIASSVFTLYAVVCLLILYVALDKIFESDNRQQSTGKGISLKNSATKLKNNTANKIVPVKKDIADFENKNLPAQTSLIDSLTTPIYGERYISKSFKITTMRGVTAFSCDAQCAIYFNSDRVRIPLQCRDYGVFLQKYLTTKPDSKLLIIGSVSDIENTQTGIKRATFVKNLLLRTGINPLQIETASRLEPLEFKNGITVGGIKMVLIDE